MDGFRKHLMTHGSDEVIDDFWLSQSHCVNNLDQLLMVDPYIALHREDVMLLFDQQFRRVRQHQDRQRSKGLACKQDRHEISRGVQKIP